MVLIDMSGKFTRRLRNTVAGAPKTLAQQITSSQPALGLQQYARLQPPQGQTPAFQQYPRLQGSLAQSPSFQQYARLQPPQGHSPAFQQYPRLQGSLGQSPSFQQYPRAQPPQGHSPAYQQYPRAQPPQGQSQPAPLSRARTPGRLLSSSHRALPHSLAREGSVRAVEGSLPVLASSSRLAPERVPWAGQTKSTIQAICSGVIGLDPAQLVIKTFCPVCLAIREKTSGCIEFKHNCSTESKVYHRELYEKYKDEQGNIHWCNICGRILDFMHGSVHFKLHNHNNPNPKGIPGAGITRKTDDACINGGGGGSIECVMRYIAYLEKSIALQSRVGEISVAEAIKQLVEYVWDAPIGTEGGPGTRGELNPERKARAIEAISSGIWPVNFDVFPGEADRPAEEEAPNIPFNGTPSKLVHYDEPKMNEVSYEEFNDFVHFSHRQPDGSIQEHECSVVSFLNNISAQLNDKSELGRCIKAPGCEAIIHPQELINPLTGEPYTAINPENGKAFPDNLYTKYKRFYNEKYKKGGRRSKKRNTRRKLNRRKKYV